jgi:probable rRNA maturation factor
MSLRLETVVDPGLNWSAVPDFSDLVAFAATRESSIPTGIWDMTVRLTDDEGIADIHLEFFNDSTPTDVISFPSGESLEAETGYLGDVVISVETAQANSHDAGHSPGREVAFLILHGILHLCGFDDSTPEERRLMLERQLQILEAYERTHQRSW